MAKSFTASSMASRVACSFVSSRICVAGSNAPPTGCTRRSRKVSAFLSANCRDGTGGRALVA
jgi:hypothetical protein